MRRVVLLWILAAALVSGCKGNDIQTEIDRWNAGFASQKTACEDGNLTACETACRMAASPTICSLVRERADMDNPAQRAWVAQCPAKAAAEGASCCLAAGMATPTPGSPVSDSVPDEAVNTYVQPSVPPVDTASPTAQVERARQQMEDALRQAEAAAGKARTDKIRLQMEAALEQAKASVEKAEQQAQTAASGSSDTPSAEKIAPISINGSLPKEIVRRTVSAQNAQFRKCYETQLAKNPDLSGKIAVKFLISGAGAVQMTAISETTVHNFEMEKCVKDVFRQMRFPQPQGGGVVVVTYPLLFTAE